MLAATTADLVVVTDLATRGILMAAVPVPDIGILLAALLDLTLALDQLNVPLLAGVRTATATTRTTTTRTTTP